MGRFRVEWAEVLRDGEIAHHPALLSAREAVHIPVMERHGIRSILTFDRWPGRPQLFAMAAEFA